MIAYLIGVFMLALIIGEVSVRYIVKSLYNGPSDERLTSLATMAPQTKGQHLYNGQAIRSQISSLCTKQLLNKGQFSIIAKILVPKDDCYREVPV